MSINKPADRVYPLFAICNAPSPRRLDDSILNIGKERYGEQFIKMSLRAKKDPRIQRSPPLHLTNSSPPTLHPSRTHARSPLISTPPQEPAKRHLKLVISDVGVQASAPTFRSFLKLYNSPDAKKLANFLEADEDTMGQQMMTMKLASRSISRVGQEGYLLDGGTVSDLDFVIDDNMVHIVELTVGRRMRAGSSAILNMRSVCSM
ncbi:hypothetical protein BD410DRAFT_367644 [Rickenella mellea]|uniref:Uncharacterized protein n=1 Tax=Rickenella mellea TaxID=50990 RepID=A0A4Y7PYV5_9AGAM|nr:hypothetical protein BD410DRAFT_367644 [Rickenella mellea]